MPMATILLFIKLKGGKKKMVFKNCKIVEKKIERFEMRLFEEEIIEAQALCLQYNLSYEQLFVKLIKEHIILKLRDE